MAVEIIATGSELVLGEQVDTNSVHIARRLREIGLAVDYKTIVGDDEPRLVEAIRIALSRVDVIIISGGLGPTLDDVTRPAVAKAVGRELVFRPDLLGQIEARFRAFGRPMGDNNRRQAYVPDGAQPIPNPVGTAPAFIVEHQGRIIASLPGVPREMEYLLEQAVLPYLKMKLGPGRVILVRTLHTVGEGESRLDALIADLQASANPVFGLSAKSGQVDVRMTATTDDLRAARRMLADMEAKVRERIGKWIFGADDDTLESMMARLLLDQRHTLATVEMNTGGLISSRLAGNQAVTGDVYVGGLVLSDAHALDRALGLEIQAEQASQAATTARAAQRIRAIHSATLGLAVAVTASDDSGGTKMHAALAHPSGVEAAERNFGGHPGLAPQFASALALGMTWRYLKQQTDMQC